MFIQGYFRSYSFKIVLLAIAFICGFNAAGTGFVLAGDIVINPVSQKMHVRVEARLNDVLRSDQETLSGLSSSTCSAVAFSNEAEGIGQQASISTEINTGTSGTGANIDLTADFSSFYNGINDSGSGAATAELSWFGRMRIMPDNVNSFYGDLVTVHIDCGQIVDSVDSSYILSWNMVVTDSDNISTTYIMNHSDSSLSGEFVAVVGPDQASSLPDIINSYDIQINAIITINKLESDINYDNKVDLLDFSLIADQWLNNQCRYSNSWCNGIDINKDSIVYTEELTSISQYWLESFSGLNSSLTLNLPFTFSAEIIQPAPQNINDNREDAIDISANMDYFGSTIDATGTDLTTCIDNGVYDIWYKFTPQHSYIYEIATEGTDDPNAVAGIALFDGAEGSEIKCWDVDAVDRIFYAEAGSPIYIRVAYPDFEKADFKLNIVYTKVHNNSCDSAEAYDDSSWSGFVTEGTLSGATGPLETSYETGDICDVWYTFMPDNISPYQFMLSSDEHDISGSITIYKGACGDLEELRYEEFDGTYYMYESLGEDTVYTIRIAGQPHNLRHFIFRVDVSGF